jgi:hAT family protein
MASSVSSERAFSSAGITISKRRNRLKGIIVEALQCLKCLYKNDLIFREVITALKEKLGMEKEELLDSAMDDDEDKDFSWDSLIDDDEDDEDDEDDL